MGVIGKSDAREKKAGSVFFDLTTNRETILLRRRKKTHPNAL